MEKILEVKNLKISFRTNNGNVKAVRDINFDLYKGETLGIVGESGSGKSVTARAILGILAGNRIIDGGELYFDGLDLLRISESTFYDIRGSRISMIYQDPLSSLNPIMRIGKQITEAMVLKSKTSHRVGRQNIRIFNKSILYNLNSLSYKDSKDLKEIVKIYRKVLIQSAKLELDYKHIKDNLVSAEKILSENIMIVETQGNNIESISTTFSQFAKRIYRSINKSLKKSNSLVFKNTDEVKMLINTYRKKKIEFTEFKTKLTSTLNSIHEEIKTVLAIEKPDFFSIAIANKTYIDAGKELKLSEEENVQVFLDKYFKYLKKAVQNSRRKSVNQKKALVEYLLENQKIFDETFTKSESKRLIKQVNKQIHQAADLLSPGKDKFFNALISQLGVHFNDYFETKISIKKDSKKSKNSTNQFTDCSEKLAKINEYYCKLIESINENIHGKIDLDEVVNNLDVDYKEHVSDYVNVVSIFEAKQNALSLMREVGIKDPEKRYKQYPFQFSGGMRQRIVIAIAISFNPDILICDEPTTALDVTIQSQILELINKIKNEHNLSVIFITHDLGVIANMADRIAVMYAGKIVEYGNVDEIFYNPRHPYTWALLSSMPDLDTKEKLESIPGTPPNMIHPPIGDAFAVRNKYAMKIDFEKQPPLFKISETHYAATWLLHPKAPKVEKPRIVTERIERVKKQLGVNLNGE